MGQRRTAWHALLAAFIDERKPASVRLETEVPLSIHPQRVDILLLRKRGARQGPARAFFRLWDLKGPLAIVEYKSRSRPPRAGTLSRLLGYGHQYVQRRQRALVDARSLSLFLLVPAITPTLRREATWLGLRLDEGDSAYAEVRGAVFPVWVVSLNALAEEESEPLLGHLGSCNIDEDDLPSRRWLEHFIMARERYVKTFDDFEEVKASFRKTDTFKEMVSELSAEELIQQNPDLRYASLLSMTDDELRALPEAFVARLPASIRDVILRRLAS